MNPKIVCEIGINHEGKVDKAVALLEDITANGLEYVKFQVWNEDYFDNDPNKEVFRKLYLSNKEIITLIAKAKELGLKWGASSFGDESDKFVIAQNPDFFKVASRRAGDEALAQKLIAAGYDKPVLVSDGMHQLVNGKRYIWNGILTQCRFLWCQSKYPTPPELAMLKFLNGTEKFHGYSDHTEGTAAMIVAGILGAEWIEKHVCTERQAYKGHIQSRHATPDIICSATAYEVKLAANDIATYRRYL